MNNISTWRVVCTFRRALWFSFVTAPALFFFVGFVFLSFNNSLAGSLWRKPVVWLRMRHPVRCGIVFHHVTPRRKTAFPRSFCETSM
jgi:hypothetical protein